jgi:four helix bundle protein
MRQSQDFTFAYERLDAYHVARELTRQTARIAAQVPRGFGYLNNHLLRSGSAPARLIAEGALRTTKGAKRQRFSEALGECGEAVATAQQALDLNLISEDSYIQLRAIAARVAAMTSRLVRKFS